MLYTILIILLILWLIGGLPQLTGGGGFGGPPIHFIWVVIVILLICWLLGYRF
jgi:hypothetical protein